MSEQSARYGRRRGALRLVGSPSATPAAARAADQQAGDQQAGVAPSAPLEQAIMYAVCGWLALCVERVAVAVDIQPIAEGVYEVSAHFDEEHTQGMLLRVRLEVAAGLVVRTVVEPLRPS